MLQTDARNPKKSVAHFQLARSRLMSQQGTGIVIVTLRLLFYGWRQIKLKRAKNQNDKHEIKWITVLSSEFFDHLNALESEYINKMGFFVTR